MDAAFRKEARLTKALIALGWLATAMLFFLPTPGKQSEIISKYAIIALMSIGAASLSFYLLVHLKRLQRASWVFTHTRPEKMFMVISPARIKGREIIAELQAGESAQGTHQTKQDRQPQDYRQIERVRILSFNAGSILKGSAWVAVFHDPKPDGIVVIQTDQGMLWGIRKGK